MPLNAASTAHVEDVRRSPAVPTRILIADPDDDTRALYREVFAHAGYEVIEATDGRDALAKVFGYSPSLLITELTLPFVNGDALCDIVRRDRVTATVPILIVTADAPMVDAERIARIGVDGVLVKPTTPDSVVREARRLLSTSREPRAWPRVTPRTPLTPHHEATADLAPAARQRRIAHTKAHQRFTTTSPPKSPPALSCPSCDRPLKYEQSNVGGVSARHPEQWDYFVCSSGCGTFQYRQRTRRLRRVE